MKKYEGLDLESYTLLSALDVEERLTSSSGRITSAERVTLCFD
jgi:hypothetical protein